jgi:Regulator of chromosome condensation (RCC1) repeat
MKLLVRALPLGVLAIVTGTGCLNDWAAARVRVDAEVPEARDSAAEESDGASVAAGDGGRAEPGEGTQPPLEPPLPACGEGCPDNAQCDTASQQCVCATGFVPHDAACIADPCFDPGACPGGRVCVVQSGQAACSCSDSKTGCGGSCVDLRTDAANCGACGYSCAYGAACAAGQCEQTVSRLVLGPDRSCAMLASTNENHTLRCWGATANNMFRDSAAEALTPRAVVGVTQVRDVALTTNRQCVVPADADVVRCWGVCNMECGLDLNEASPGVTFADAVLSGIKNIAAVAYTGGSRPGGAAGSTCAIAASGALRCWGNGTQITTSSSSRWPQSVTITGVPSPLTYASVSGDYAHFCATTRTGQAHCWGLPIGQYNEMGVASTRIGQGGINYGVVVEKEGGEALSDVALVDADMVGNCAVTKGGELWCWGDNTIGGLGIGDTLSHVGAVKVALSDVVQVAGGVDHRCALIRDGQVHCWGNAGRAGLGADARGTYVGSGGVTAFILPQAVPTLTDVEEIAAGYTHSCARRRSGQVVCWGENGKGQLGDGTTVTRYVPTPIASFE